MRDEDGNVKHGRCSCGMGDHPSISHQEHELDCPLAEGPGWEPEQPEGVVLTFRSPGTGQPVAVPERVVLEAERPYRAWKMLERGLSWGQIAAFEGYADAAAAKYDVQRYLNEGQALVTDFSRREQLELDVQRLNTLQAVVWPQAMKGHLPAVKTAMDLVGMRGKLLGYTELPPSDEEKDGARTVIIPSGDDDYGAALRRAAGEPDDPEAAPRIPSEHTDQEDQDDRDR